MNISWKFCRFRLDLDHFSFKLPSKQTYQVSQMENFRQQIWFRKSCCCLLPSKQTCPLATVILNCCFCHLKKSCYYLLPSKQINQLFRVTLRFTLFLRLFFEKLFCCRLPFRKIFQLVMATLKYNFYHLDYYPKPFMQTYRLFMEILQFSFYFKKSYCCQSPSM